MLDSAKAESSMQLVPMYLPSTAPQATVEAQVVIAFWRHSDNSGGDWLIAAGEKDESMIPIPTALCGFNNTFIWNWAILYKNKIQIFSEKWFSNYDFFPNPTKDNRVFFFF